MKKIIVSLLAFCALCGSAFADVTITDWAVFKDYVESTVYDGLMTDSGSAGFTVHANPEMWVENDRPCAAFQSNSISPGLVIDLQTTTFEVSVTGFDNDLLKRLVNVSDRNDVPRVDNISLDNRGLIRVGFMGFDSHYLLVYAVNWVGDGVYKFTRKNADGGSSPALRDPFEVSAISIGFIAPQESLPDYPGYYYGGYYLGDSTQGTVEFAFPASAEVPEPSSLLALAFGGAGTVTLAVRRKK